jgi:hypothetical protein
VAVGSIQSKKVQKCQKNAKKNAKKCQKNAEKFQKIAINSKIFRFKGMDFF